MGQGFHADEFHSTLSRLNDDMRGLPRPLPHLSLYDPRTGEGAGPEFDVLRAFLRQDDMDAAWGRFGEHAFRLTAETQDDLLVALAAAVQDDVIDLLGRGWPETRTAEGAFGGILTPTVDAVGRPVWATSSGTAVAIGDLASMGTHVAW